MRRYIQVFMFKLWRKCFTRCSYSYLSNWFSLMWSHLCLHDLQAPQVQERTISGSLFSYQQELQINQRLVQLLFPVEFARMVADKSVSNTIKTSTRSLGSGSVSPMAPKFTPSNSSYHHNTTTATVSNALTTQRKNQPWLFRQKLLLPIIQWRVPILNGTNYKEIMFEMNELVAVISCHTLTEQIIMEDQDVFLQNQFVENPSMDLIKCQ